VIKLNDITTDCSFVGPYFAVYVDFIKIFIAYFVVFDITI